MIPALSSHKNIMIFAISSGVANLPMGTVAALCFKNSFFDILSFFALSLAKSEIYCKTPPGRVFIVIPNAPTS